MANWQAPHPNQTWYAYDHTRIGNDNIRQELGVYMLDVHCLRRIYHILRQTDVNSYYSLVIDWSHLCESCPELAELVMKAPRRMLPLLDAAFRDTQLSVIRSSDAHREQVQRDSQPSPPAISSLLTQRMAQERMRTASSNASSIESSPLLFKPKCHVRLRNTFFAGLDRLPRSLDVNRLVAVRGTVIRASPVKMLEWRREVECIQCKHRWVVNADIEQHYRFDTIMHCPSDTTPACKSKKFEVVTGSAECRDYQELKIQEQIQKIGFGSIPRSILVIAEDDLVDVCQPGDDILIIGAVVSRWDRLMLGARCNVELVIAANNIRVNNQAATTGSLSDELGTDVEAFWAKFVNRPLVGRDFILNSICPQIFGLHLVKLALAVVLLGGVEKQDKSGMCVRGVCHLLLVGDPGTGKSQFLTYASKLIPRSVLTTGIGTTSAGLTAAAVRDAGSGGDWVLEAGALVLADGGVCCIDEFNSIRSTDRTTIHEAMEQQSISVAKVGLVCKLNTRCSVIAATNPKGNYDPSASISANCAIGTPLLSRFDLVLLMLDERNDEWDRRVSSHILSGQQESEVAEAERAASKSQRVSQKVRSSHQKKATSHGHRAQDLSQSIASGENDVSESYRWGLETVRSYFLLAIHKFQPELTKAAKMILTAYYRLQRRADIRSLARTTIRLLESSIRLAQGHARLMWRNYACIQDAVVAISLIESSVQSCALLRMPNVMHSSFGQNPDTQCIEILANIEIEMATLDGLEFDREELLAMDAIEIRKWKQNKKENPNNHVSGKSSDDDQDPPTHSDTPPDSPSHPNGVNPPLPPQRQVSHSNKRPIQRSVPLSSSSSSQASRSSRETGSAGINSHGLPRPDAIIEKRNHENQKQSSSESSATAEQGKDDGISSTPLLHPNHASPKIGDFMPSPKKSDANQVRPQVRPPQTFTQAEGLLSPHSAKRLPSPKKSSERLPLGSSPPVASWKKVRKEKFITSSPSPPPLVKSRKAADAVSGSGAQDLSAMSEDSSFSLPDPDEMVKQKEGLSDMEIGSQPWNSPKHSEKKGELERGGNGNEKIDEGDDEADFLMQLQDQLERELEMSMEEEKELSSASPQQVTMKVDPALKINSPSAPFMKERSSRGIRTPRSKKRRKRFLD